MNKETLALIFLIGVAGLVILAFVLNDAYGHIPPETGQPTTRQFLPIVHVLEHILEEEKKQTALLDHIDCMIYTNKDVSNDLRHRQACGTPLNLTGVWNP